MFLKGASSQLSSTQVNEYRNTAVPSQLSYYNSIIDYVEFGDDAFPNVSGVKGSLSGSLIGGQEEDFVNI